MVIFNKNELNTELFALLDTQSDTNFVLDSIPEKLGIVGNETKLLLSTMVSKNQVIDTKRFEGLMVRGYDRSVKIKHRQLFHEL